MSAKAHHAISSLFSRFIYDCKRLRSNQEEMNRLSDSYFRYRDLLHEQERMCDEIVKTFGILGVHSPDVSKDLASSIASGVSPKLANLVRADSDQGEAITISSADVRAELKVWEILEVFLSAVDNEASVADFKRFLHQLDMRDKATPQALESALKTHPDLFQERTEGGQKLMALRHSAPWIQTWQAVLSSVRALIAEARQRFAPDAHKIELIEQPARTVVIRANGTPGALVQATISLDCDRIEIKTRNQRSYGIDDEVDVIEIRPQESSIVYVYQGQILAGSEQVAEIILAPVLDCVRSC